MVHTVGGAGLAANTREERYSRKKLRLGRLNWSALVNDLRLFRPPIQNAAINDLAHRRQLGS